MRPSLYTGALRLLSRRMRPAHTLVLPLASAASASSIRARCASGVVREKRGSPLAGEKAFAPDRSTLDGSGESMGAVRRGSNGGCWVGVAIVAGGDSGATE